MSLRKTNVLTILHRLNVANKIHIYIFYWKFEQESAPNHLVPERLQNPQQGYAVLCLQQCVKCRFPTDSKDKKKILRTIGRYQCTSMVPMKYAANRQFYFSTRGLQRRVKCIYLTNTRDDWLRRNNPIDNNSGKERRNKGT